MLSLIGYSNHKRDGNLRGEDRSDLVLLKERDELAASSHYTISKKVRCGQAGKVNPGGRRRTAGVVNRPSVNRGLIDGRPADRPTGLKNLIDRPTKRGLVY